MFFIIQKTLLYKFGIFKNKVNTITTRKKQKQNPFNPTKK